MRKQACISALGLFASAVVLFGQDNVPIIRAEVVSTFVWGEDARSGAVSSVVHDPLTGHTIRKLSYGGIEVSSKLAYERVAPDKMGIFLIVSGTVVNATETAALVRYGGVNVDGHAVPLPIVSTGKKSSRKDRKKNFDSVALDKMNCFRSGYISTEAVFSSDKASRALTVAPGAAVTVLSLFRDPRTYQPLLCSTDGCFPTGTIRYYITVNGQDYVFVWPGRSAVNCGK